MEIFRTPSLLHFMKMAALSAIRVFLKLGIRVSSSNVLCVSVQGEVEMVSY